MDDKLPSKRFGEKLRILRRKQGLTQKELGELVGVVKTYIGRMENSEKTPNLAMLLKLRRIFNVSIDVMVVDELELDSE